MPNKTWSYNAGKKGQNWCRAYEHRPGVFYLEFFENTEEGKKRKRLSVKGAKTKADAAQAAETLAQVLSEHAPIDVSGPLTLSRLFAIYEREMLPQKSKREKEYNKRAMKMFLSVFGAQTEPAKIGRVRYNEFIRKRRSGEIRGFEKVKDRAVERDIRFMNAVFNWATVERDDGTVLMQRNPWRGLPVPHEKNPTRVGLNPEWEQTLLDGSDNWRFKLALILVRETGRRLNSVRRIRWSDVQVRKFEEGGETHWRGQIRWLPEYDKRGKGRVTPITERAARALYEAPRGIGDAWVLPSPEDAKRPCSQDYFSTYMDRLKHRLGLNIRGLGYHSGKRSKIRDPQFRKLDPKIREALVDTTIEIQRRVYDDVVLEDLEVAVAELEGRVQAG